MDHWFWWRDFVLFEILMEQHNSAHCLLPVNGMEKYQYDL